MEKAQDLLGDARIAFGVGLNNSAGRDAYLAGFHAAQSYIFEVTGKTSKTHNGVQNLFFQLAVKDDTIPDFIRTFVSRAYNLKAVADYETGPGSRIPVEKVEWAIATAERFLTCIASTLANRSSSSAN